MGATARVRAFVAWAVVGGVAATGLMVARTSSADARSTAEAEEVTDRGGQLYQRWCAVCHATDGTGTGAGPPINAVPVALVDLTMRTGDMPMTDPSRGVGEQEFTDGEREATLAFMIDRFGLTGAVEAPGRGDAGRGQDVYTVHCAQCHGGTGEGGVAGAQATVPSARGREPILVAQAVRTGPFQMPPFDTDLIDDDELDDLVAFLEDRPSNSPLGLADLTRVAAFGWAMLLGAVILAACWWTAHVPVRAPDADMAAEADPEPSSPEESSP